MTDPDSQARINALIDDELIRERIRQVATEQSKPTKLKAFLAHPLTAVLLAGLLGVGLTNYYEIRRLETEDHLITKRAEADRVSNIKENELKQSYEIFQEISHLLDRRMWCSRRVLWAYRQNLQKNELQSRKLDYDQILVEWNQSINKNFSLIESYFGQERRDELENGITPRFVYINDALFSKRHNLDSAESRIDQLNPLVYGFNTNLLSQIKQGQVGRTIHE